MKPPTARSRASHCHLAALGAALAGCTVSDGIEGSDDTYFPTVRVVINDAQFADDQDPDAETRYTSAVELSVTGANGDFDPDGTVLTEADYSLIEASVSWRGGIVVHDNLRFELVTGIGYVNADIEGMGMSGFSISENTDRFGLLLGGRVGWEPIPRVELYARATALPLYLEALSTQLEAGVQYRPVDHVSLLLAYRRWDYESEDFGDFLSSSPQTDIELTGLTFGLVFDF